MIFTEMEQKKLEQSALKYYQEGFHPDDWVTIEYDSRGIAVNLSRPLPKDADIFMSDAVYLKLGNFLPS